MASNRLWALGGCCLHRPRGSAQQGGCFGRRKAPRVEKLFFFFLQLHLGLSGCTAWRACDDLRAQSSLETRNHVPLELGYSSAKRREAPSPPAPRPPQLRHAQRPRARRPGARSPRAARTPRPHPPHPRAPPASPAADSGSAGRAAAPAPGRLPAAGGSAHPAEARLPVPREAGRRALIGPGRRAVGSQARLSAAAHFSQGSCACAQLPGRAGRRGLKSLVPSLERDRRALQPSRGGREGTRQPGRNAASGADPAEGPIGVGVEG